MNIKDRETRSLIIVIILTLFMQFFSLIRNSISASLFGISTQMDAYNISFNLTTFLFSFFGTAVTTVLIPNIAGKKTFSKGVNSFITYLFLCSLLVSILGFIFNKQILSIIAGTQNKDFIDMASLLLSIFLIGNVFSFILGVNSAIFQVRNRVLMLKITQLISYIYIVGMLLLIVVNSKSIYHFATVIMTANILNLILQLYYLKKENIIFSFDFSINDREFIIMIKNLLPVFFSTGLYQFSLMIDTVLASRLGEGQVSILSYSNQIVIIINSLILANIILFIYPKIAVQINKSIDYAKEKLLDYLLLAFFIMIFIVLVFILAGKEGIAILYERGAFTNEITEIVYYLTMVYIIVLPLNAMRELFYKFFYSDNDTFTPFKNSIKASIYNIILSLFLSQIWGIYGIVLGTAISTVLSMGMILNKFNKKYNKIFNVGFLYESLKIMISFIVTLFIGGYVIQIFEAWNLIVYVIAVSIVNFIIFIMILKIMKSRIFKINL